MQDPIQFYKEERDKYQQILKKLKKQLITSSSLRLFVFLATIFGIYYFLGNAEIIILIVTIGFSFFFFLIIKHTNLKYQRDLNKELLDQNQLEIDVFNKDISKLNEGSEFIDSNHFYSYDIDLFGRGSFFQFVNRTATNDGKVLLASILTSNNVQNIKQKQEAIKELAFKPKWRQHFTALASLVKVRHPAKSILKWIHEYSSKFEKFVSWIPQIFSIISFVLIGLLSFGFLGFNIVLFWFFIGLGISGKYFKKVNEIYQNADKAKSTFKQYYKLLKEIEIAKFDSELLREEQSKIRIENEKASKVFAKFSKYLDALDQRNNVIIAVFGNGLFLRDLQIAYNIEKWIEKYASRTENWFNVIAFFDAQNSFANMAFNHPEYVFPNIQKESDIINGKQLGHPLLRVEQRVDNSFSIENQQFFIITGANMAGKSTFLRTISLAIVMSNVGLPVCAQSFNYSPIKLITSMRTSDSLADDESYFFSELKRLKFIVEEIKRENYFIILDEILKGTNSTDKAIGSKKFIQKLVGSNSTGIIATHDLSLCEIEKELAEIKNYYFDAEIINNELHFDYKLKEGICKNMNASFLLKKMEIV